MQQKTFDLNTLNGANGFTVPGIAGDHLGQSVSTAGDINGDGLSDLVLGAFDANAGNGAAYVIFSSPGGFVSPFNLTNLNGNNGFRVPGIASNGRLGVSVSTAGDINGDNLTDLVLGAYFANGGYGAAYVIFGSRGGFVSPFNLTNLNGNNGFMVPGIASGGQLGVSVSTAGDINGDNLTDLVLGASTANSANGTAYVIFGSRGGFVSPFNLANLNGNNGFRVPGIASGGQLGVSVSMAGDINGDNITDLVLGAPVANSANGAAYVLFGSRGGFVSPFNLTNLNGNNGFMVPGESGPLSLGYSVSTAGDINGDNITDLVLGATNSASSVNGMAYVIFGSRGGFVSPFNLTNLNGNNGFRVPGIASGGRLGFSVSTAGDINGDNITDLVLGAYGANSANGTAYAIFGSRGGFVSPFNLTNLNGNNGFRVPGIASGGWLGFSVSTAGDINGDNITDLVLGASTANSANGAAYVIFGTPLALINNQMTIMQGQSLLLTNAQLSARDFSNTTAANLVFTVSNLQGGRFELVSNPGTSLTTFTQQQMTNNQIRFVSDRTAVVSYAIGVTYGQFILQPALANINFTNPVPIVINILPSQFVQPNQPFHFIFPANQTFTEPDGDPLTYFATLSNGSSLPNWLNFNAISPNQLDFTGTVPLLGTTQVTVVAQDPLNATVNTSFSLVAKSMWVNNQMTITQGQSVLLSSTDLDATGLNDLPADIVFTVSNLQGGRFELVSNQDASVANFTQQQINSNQVRFVSNRTAPVAYNVSVTDGQFTLPPLPANVNFTNHAPDVISTPATQLIEPNKPFQFSLQADQIFNDTDGDPLRYSATLSGGAALPSWMRFDSQSNQLAFSGTAPAPGGTVVSLSAQDPLNATAKTQFEVLAASSGNQTSITNGSAVNQIAVPVAVAVGISSLAAAAFGFWRYFSNKKGREGHQLANYLRDSLKLKGVDNFYETENGRKYVTTVQGFSDALKLQGIDVGSMENDEIKSLADDIAYAARNKITNATDCLGYSVITVSDLKSRMQDIVVEAQQLRSDYSSRPTVT